MPKVGAFVRMDFYTIKPYYKSYLFLAVMAVALAVTMNSVLTLYAYILMGLLLTMSYPFSIGETNRLDTLYATLTQKRAYTVRGRYVFALCMELIAVVLMLVAFLASSLFPDMGVESREMLLFICIGFSVFAFAVSLQFPIYFKLGYNKAKYIGLAPLVLVSLGIFFVSRWINTAGGERLLSAVLDIWTRHPVLSCLLPLAVSHLILLVSCLLSTRLYKRRDLN